MFLGAGDMLSNDIPIASLTACILASNSASWKTLSFYMSFILFISDLISPCTVKIIVTYSARMALIVSRNGFSVLLFRRSWCFLKSYSSRCSSVTLSCAR